MESGSRELALGHPLQVAGHERQMGVLPASELLQHAGDSRDHRVREISRAELVVALLRMGDERLHARIDLRIGEASATQELAHDDVAIGAARRIHLPERLGPVHGMKCLNDGLRVLIGGTPHQRAVDIEEQQPAGGCGMSGRGSHPCRQPARRR